MYKQQQNEEKWPPFGPHCLLFGPLGGERADLALSHWQKEKTLLFIYPRVKLSRDSLEVPRGNTREARPVVTLNSYLCECGKGLLLGPSVGAPKGGTLHSEPSKDNAGPSPAELGHGQEAF